jgi:hypothetical protein
MLQVQRERSKKLLSTVKTSKEILIGLKRRKLRMLSQKRIMSQHQILKISDTRKTCFRTHTS